jgi:hypothetical protein
MNKQVKQTVEEFIKIDGIEWCRKNLTVEANEYFSFDEMQKVAEVAEAAGLRIPTFEEYRSLCGLPRVWDKGEQGMWFADKGWDLKYLNLSLFLPASGCRYNWLGELKSDGAYEMYWSDPSSRTLFGLNLYAYHNDMRFNDCTDYNFKLPVRCIRK